MDTEWAGADGGAEDNAKDTAGRSWHSRGGGGGGGGGESVNDGKRKGAVGVVVLFERRRTSDCSAGPEAPRAEGTSILLPISVFPAN